MQRARDAEGALRRGRPTQGVPYAGGVQGSVRVGAYLTSPQTRHRASAEKLRAGQLQQQELQQQEHQQQE